MLYQKMADKVDRILVAMRPGMSKYAARTEQIRQQRDHDTVNFFHFQIKRWKVNGILRGSGFKSNKTRSNDCIEEALSARSLIERMF